MSTVTSSGGFSSFLNSRGMSVFLLILSIIILGFLIANAVYFNKIENDQNQTSTKKSEAKTMKYINITLSIIMGLFVIYYAWKSLQSPEYVQVVQAQALAKADVYYDKAAKGLSGISASVDNISMPLNQIYTNPVNGAKVPVTYKGDGVYVDPMGIKYSCPDYQCQPLSTQNANPQVYQPITYQQIPVQPVYQQPVYQQPIVVTNPALPPPLNIK